MMFSFRENIVNVQWTGYAKRIPVLLFSVDAVFRKNPNFRTVAGEEKKKCFVCFNTTY